MELFFQFSSLFLDWFDLLVRWTHVVVGVAWIGTSFYFNWLDSRLNREINNEETEGELWSIHAGGFYKINKLKGLPKKLPQELHWFKWEAYATWISGFALLIIIYYFNTETLMINASTNNLSSSTAIMISLLFLLGSWFVYDLICKSPLKNNTVILSIVFFTLMVIASFALTKIFNSRAAYIHIGACLGTIMAANVFRVIIPSQKILVNAALKNTVPDMKKSINAKIRSLHNNYMTLPVLFIMVSSHYPFTYGHKYNWTILAILSVIGVAIRHYFNLRNKKQQKAWMLSTIMICTIALILYTTIPKVILNKKNSAMVSEDKISFIEINHIIKIRCAVCHASNPTFEDVEWAPMGIIYDTPEDILNNIKKIKAQVIDSEIMPPGNITNITVEERRKISLWIQQGANISE